MTANNMPPPPPPMEFMKQFGNTGNHPWTAAGVHAYHAASASGVGPFVPHPHPPHRAASVADVHVGTSHGPPNTFMSPQHPHSHPSSASLGFHGNSVPARSMPFHLLGSPSPSTLWKVGQQTQNPQEQRSLQQEKEIPDSKSSVDGGEKHSKNLPIVKSQGANSVEEQRNAISKSPSAAANSSNINILPVPLPVPVPLPSMWGLLPTKASKTKSRKSPFFANNRGSLKQGMMMSAASGYRNPYGFGGPTKHLNFASSSDKKRVVGVTEEQIATAIPKDASAIFHILDRRINFDAFPEDASVYSLLRAWVQDDPYRFIPSHESNLRRSSKKEDKEADSIRYPCRSKVERDRGDISSSCDILSILRENNNKNKGVDEIPSILDLKKEVTGKGIALRNLRQKEHHKMLKVAAEKLRRRGYHLFSFHSSNYLVN